MKKDMLTLCFLILLSCNFQAKNSDDTVMLYKVFFADGFDFDKVEFKINDKEIFKSKLKSNRIDGLTSKIFRINKKEDIYLLTRNEGDEVTLDNTGKLVLTVLHESEVYNLQLKEELGSYVLIELINDNIIINQQIKEPIFD